MRYTSLDVPCGAYVTDLDTLERLSRVLAVDTDRGEVELHVEPFRPVDGRIPVSVVRFAAIWPIMDRGIPCAFHCHGRMG